MVDSLPIPQHIGIIMDGNGRWATARKLPRATGHREGLEAMHRVIDASLELKVPYLTLYAFSTENWRRPQDEVDYLMSLPGEFYKRERRNLRRHGVRVVVIGERDGVPKDTLMAIERLQEETRDLTAMTLIMAFNYGGRTEIIKAANRLLEQAVAAQEAKPITDEALSRELYTRGYPEPDLIIRSGGEMRLSNFLLWQSAYAELHFSDTLWPDFTEADFRAAIAAYQKRQRRYGGLSSEELGS